MFQNFASNNSKSFRIKCYSFAFCPFYLVMFLKPCMMLFTSSLYTSLLGACVHVAYTLLLLLLLLLQHSFLLPEFPHGRNQCSHCSLYVWVTFLKTLTDNYFTDNETSFPIKIRVILGSHSNHLPP